MNNKITKYLFPTTKVMLPVLIQLMFSYQLLVSIIGKFLQIDPYDQLCVENGKIILTEN